MPLFSSIAIFVSAAILSALVVAIVRRWALRMSILDQPNERSSHSQPTPRGGGIAIVVLTTVALLVAAPLAGWSALRTGALVAASLLVAGTSWLDDLRHLPSALRLAVHITAAGMVIAAFGGWDRIPVPFAGQVETGAVGIALTLVWIVGLTNAYNFMDGIDGIAGGQAITAGTGWALLGAHLGEPVIAVAGLVMAGSAAGFLLHNWQPARVFMGDVGSAFLGFLLASLAVIGARRTADMALAGVLLVWPFVFDASLTFLRRLFRGENVFEPHRNHLYQRLVRVGFSHSFVAAVYLALAATGALAAVAVAKGATGAGTWATAGVLALAAGLWGSVSAIERRHRAPVD